MGIEVSQTEEHFNLNRAPQPEMCFSYEMEPGARTEVTFPQDFTPFIFKHFN